MQNFICSDNHVVATKLRHVLENQGLACGLSNVVSLNRCVESIQHAGGDVDLALLVLPADHLRGVALVQALRPHVSGWLVAVGEARDAKSILDIVHLGADDYLDETGDLVAQLTELLARLRTSGASSQRQQPHLLTVASPSGGGGGSLVASNLAVALAQTQGDCGLLDLVTFRSDLATLLNLKPRHTLADLCHNVEKLDRKMFEQSLTRHDCGVRLLAGPQSPGDIQQITADGVRKVLRLACSAFDWLVCDAGNLAESLETELVHTSHKLAIVFRLDFTSIRNVRRLLDRWQPLVEPDKIALVANRCGQPGELPVERAEEALQQPIAYRLPDDPKTANLCVNCGLPLLLEAPRSKLGKALAEFAGAIRGEPADAKSAAAVQPGPRKSPLLDWAGLKALFDLGPRLAKVAQ